MLCDTVNKIFPWFNDYFEKYGELSLCEVQRNFKQTTLCPSDEFILKCVSYTQNVYGYSIAQKLKQTLEKGYCAYFANHGGFENHPQLISSTLCALAYEILTEKNIHPIFACTSIGAQNPTLPTGFISSQLSDNFKRKKACLYSSKYRDVLLNNLPKLDNEKFLKVLKSAQEKGFSNKEIAALKKLSPVFRSFNQRELIYSSSIFNSAAYSYFMPSEPETKAIFLDIDKIGTELLTDDLKDDHSFISKLIDNKNVLEQILFSLCNVSGCWSEDLIHFKTGTSYKSMGSILFFEISETGRKSPLRLLKKDNNDYYLKGERLFFKLQREEINSLLISGDIIPGIYVLQSNIAFTHNLSLTGGIFMRTYFEAMVQATIKAFLKAGIDFSFIAAKQKLTMVSSMPLPFYIREDNCNQNTVLDKLNEVHPISLLDLFCKKLDISTIEKMMSVKLKEIKEASACDLLLEYGSYNLIKDNIQEILEYRASGFILS